MMCKLILTYFFFFFNDTATTEIYTLSLHDALPISTPTTQTLAESEQTERALAELLMRWNEIKNRDVKALNEQDRKSTRLNSSHSQISYAVFCLKKKKMLKIIYIH